jgi:hypothetical protein
MAATAIPIELGEWAPDLPSVATLGEAKNVIPRVASYRSLNDLLVVTAALENPALGLATFQIDESTYITFAGDNSRLYALGTGTKVGGGSASTFEWGDVSETNGYSSVTRWEFVRYRDTVVALNGGDPQKWTLGTSTEFEDLSGGPPDAYSGAVIGDFLMLGNLPNNPYRIQWSGWNDIEEWSTFDVENRAGFIEFSADGGVVKRVLGGQRRGLVLREQSAVFVDFAGGPQVFRVTDARHVGGLAAVDAVAQLGSDVYYYSRDGFKSVNMQSGQVRDIGQNRVDQWFANTAVTGRIQDMQAVVDPVERVVYFSFRAEGGDSSNSFHDTLLLYSINADRWSYAKVNAEQLGLFWDTSTDAFPFDDIDQTEARIDDPTFRSGDRLRLCAFNMLNELATWTGDPLEATITTPEFSGRGEARVFVNRVRPIVEGSPDTDIKVAMLTRDDLTQPRKESPQVSLNRIGEAPVRVKGRFTRAKITITGGFQHLRSVTAYVREPSSGRR